MVVLIQWQCLLTLTSKYENLITNFTSCSLQLLFGKIYQIYNKKVGKIICKRLLLLTCL